MCLQSHCLATAISSGSTILALSPRVTILLKGLPFTNSYLPIQRKQKLSRSTFGRNDECAARPHKRSSICEDNIKKDNWNRDSSVCIMISYGLDGRGTVVRLQAGAKDFPPRRPTRLWSPPNLLSNGYWGQFPGR
jgi:hypothetical protein